MKTESYDSALRALLSLRGLRGAPEDPPLCRETSVSRIANVGTVGKNWLRKHNGGQKWVKCVVIHSPANTEQLLLLLRKTFVILFVYFYSIAEKREAKKGANRRPAQLHVLLMIFNTLRNIHSSYLLMLQCSLSRKFQ